MSKRYSQNNEQDIILDYINKRQMATGKLLDIGAYDGETFSNVKELMNQYKGWKGVFVEPSSHCFVRLYESYKMEPKRAELINIAVVLEAELGNERLLQFYDSPMSAVSSSIESWTNRGIGEQGKEYNAEGDCVNPRKVIVGQIGMKEILERFGPFDFINIDVEGYSAKLALQDWFDPRNYGCSLLCVENDGMHTELQQKFFGYGYSLIGNSWENLIFGLTK
jgi:FkbM family methyltransferase